MFCIHVAETVDVHDGLRKMFSKRAERSSRGLRPLGGIDLVYLVSLIEHARPGGMFLAARSSYLAVVPEV